MRFMNGSFRGNSAYLFPVFAVILLFIFPFSGTSQTRQGTISGTVVDANGDAVVGAEIILAGPDNSKIKLRSDQDGRFSVEVLSIGEFSVSASAASFKGANRLVNVLPGKTSELSIVLEIDETRVTVTAEIGSTNTVSETSQNVSILSADELRQRGNSVLAQAGEEETGLNVQATSPTLGAIVVRGLTGKNVVHFVDGIRYSNSAQRGGINTFFNLNDAANLNSIEVLRGPDSAQYGSDSLGGTVNLLTKSTPPGLRDNKLHGEMSAGYFSAARSPGSTANFGYTAERIGIQFNLYGRRVGDLRTAKGIDSHSSITRFLGLPSRVLYTRSPDTGFSQYGGSVRFDYEADETKQLVIYYQRGQQDGGKRFDQLVGGDGNLIADLRNLMGDFGYLRYYGTSFGVFDTGSLSVSYNSQREERVNQGGQGNPFSDITHSYERTTAIGTSFFFGRNLFAGNQLIFGGEFYRETIDSPAFTVRPTNNTSFLSRPRIPDNAKFRFGGLFVQDSWKTFRERLRITGSFRYSGASYKAKAADSPLVNGRTLWGDDKLFSDSFSGRIGGVYAFNPNLSVSASYSGGFRFPSMTDVGTLGLTGDGFEVDFQSANALGGTIGTTADENALNTGIPVAEQSPEFSRNFDVRFRYENSRFEATASFFNLVMEDTIVKQALILPQGSAGLTIGGQTIISQLPNGTVFVPLSSAPVLVRTNFTEAVLRGVELDAKMRLGAQLDIAAGYTFIRSEDRDTGEPPNIEGGTPPPNGFAKLIYRPNGRFWFEAVATAANRQDRLSSLDLGDRRTGARRSRSQIANFFRRGACVRGLVSNPDGVCGTGDESILLLTGETLAQVQTRVLGTANSAVLFDHLPGYLVLKFRGGIRVTEKSNVYWSFENPFDVIYRNPSWGIDGAGRGFRLGYRVMF